jgi:hypothetical protein
MKNKKLGLYQGTMGKVCPTKTNTRGQSCENLVWLTQTGKSGINKSIKILKNAHKPRLSPTRFYSTFPLVSSL